jgi:hypothetical protein
VNDLVPAALLWALTLSRAPLLGTAATRDPFLGSVLAASALTLYVPLVYVSVDRAIGGGNLVGLLLSLMMVTSLWRIQASLSRACGHGRRSRTPWNVFWLATVAIMGGSFPSWDAPVSTRDLVSRYGAQPGLLVFQATACVFIFAVCVQGIMVVKRNLATMGSSFRVAFGLVAIGFALAAPLLLLRVGANFANGPVKAHLESTYELGQQIVVMFVSLGLSLPRLRTMWNNAVVSLRARLHLARLREPWQRLSRMHPELIVDASSYSLLEPFRSGAVGRLNRRLAEIKDISALTHDEPGVEDLIRSAESVFPPLYRRG